jgi:excisionase family DNA binding protein
LKELDDQEATAGYLGVAVRTVEDWRYRGTGPAFVRCGRQIRYRRADVDSWIESQRVEPGSNRVA